MKADFHMHTNFSSDSDATPKKMVEEAIRLGLRTICITDHQDSDYPNRGNGEEFQLDFPGYVSAMQKLREEYKDKIEILLGVELGLQPHLGERYKTMASQYPFDYIIGSVHVIDGLDPYYGVYFQDKTDAEGYRRAFEVTMENLKAIRDFDSLGHMDYVVRYGRGKESTYRCLDCMDIIDEILRFLIQNGKGLEVNTAGWKYGLSFAHPYPDILKRYKELGGEILTVGSDGHKPEHIAYDFERVSPLLKACGFKYYSEFRKRKPVFIELP